MSQRSAALRLSQRGLNRALLARQHLVERLPAGTGTAAAVAAIGPLQAQYNPSPFLALLARMDGFDSAQLRSPIDSFGVVKASLMRGTLHVVAGADYRRYASAVDAPVTRMWKTWLGKLLDVEPMQAALLDLTDPGPCGLAEVVEFCQAWVHDHAARGTELPAAGNWFFARCYPWLLRTPQTTQLAEHKPDGYLAARSIRTEWAPPGNEGALADAVRAYLTHFGPAGLDDIGKFLGESRVRAVRDAVSTLGEQIVPVVDEDGRALVDLVEAPRPPEDLEVPVRMLPKFDSLTLAYASAHRGRTLPPAFYDAVFKTVNGQVMATVLVDGWVAGTWAASNKKGGAQVAVSPLGRWRAGVRASVRAEAERIGAFLAQDQGEVRVTFE